MTPLSFTRDPRIATLSFAARDLLHNLLEQFPQILSENGKVEVTAAYLRQQCYPDRTDIHDTHIGRWLKELSASSIVTLAKTSHRSSWLSLEQPCAHPLPASLPRGEALRGHPEPPKADAGSGSGPPKDGLAVARLIHISAGLSPPDHQKLAVVVATAADSLDLIARLREHFPRHDVAIEWRRYKAHREKFKRPIVASKFIDWMLRAEPEIKSKPGPGGTSSVSSHNKSPSSELPAPCSNQLDLFEEANHRRFLEQMADRKHRA
jgi:hypothetical protein